MVALATMQEEQENFEDFRIFQVICNTHRRPLRVIVPSPI